MLPHEEQPAEQWTLEELHDAFGRDLHRFVARRIRDPELARDLVQETFLRAYLARNGCNKERPAWPWLATIARNLIYNTCRDENRRRNVLGSTVGWNEAAGCVDTSSDVDPESSYTRTQRRAAIDQALASLPGRQRRVLLLRCGHDLSYEEIAGVEGISRDAVKSLIKRARQAFRDNYELEEREAG